MIDGTNLPYAGTVVSIDKSKNEINDLLKRFGVKGIQWTWMDNQEILRFLHDFELNGVKHSVGFEIQVPEMGSKQGRGYERKLVRNDNQAYRVVWHVLKNRFVAIECGLKSLLPPEYRFIIDRLEGK